MSLQPIETRYQGYRFRSRLEARWAVFFDCMAVRWEYEPQGFTTRHGPYLPDFRLRGDLFVEIKYRLWAADVTDPQTQRMVAFAVTTPLLLIRGDPGDCLLHILSADGSTELRLGECRKCETLALCSDDGAVRTMFCDSSCESEKLIPGGVAVCDAINAARGARFEHGESGSHSEGAA